MCEKLCDSHGYGVIDNFKTLAKLCLKTHTAVSKKRNILQYNLNVINAKKKLYKDYLIRLLLF